MTVITPALEQAFVDATRMAARAVHPLVGSGDKDAVDSAAVVALRGALDGIDVEGRVVVGEGEKDAAPMLFVGELFGAASAADGPAASVPAVDIAVDPVDGTRSAAAGVSGAIVVLAVAPRGALLDLGPAYYLQKLVSWIPDAARTLDEPVAITLERLSARTGRPISGLTVAVQERPRNAGFAAEAAAAGARVELFADGDVERAFRALLPGGDIDLLLGIGGAPEGVITAAAARMLGGTMLARFAPQGATEAERLAAAGLDPERTYGRDELCSADALVVVSSVTGIDLGDGARLVPVSAAGAVHSWTLGSGGTTVSLG
ncbi:fructose-bisphosphatase class II [Leifsonia sp. YIM 134122]|uniref:Fructose-1,6-bisphosphatase n=1 Tax=Leifsonia stereocauli TaxID=3134136 RepID=A0ABU9VZY8_9MICO